MGPEPVSSAERLALTLRFLTTGGSYCTLHLQSTISRSAISYIVNEVCQAIFKVLSPIIK